MMTETPRKFIRVPKGSAAAPTRPAPTMAERLDEWLVMWGDWVRAFRVNSEQNEDLSRSAAFADLPSDRQWETTLEVLESLRLEDRTLRGLDACVSELSKAHYIVIHWHYARSYRRRGVPAVLSTYQLPKDGTAEYEALLDAARDALAIKVIRARVLIPE
jgi:hypothetical protein